MRRTPSHPARLALILLAALLFLSAGKTSAQTPTRVVVDPPLSSVQPGQSFTVRVMVENVSDLWAYDLKLSFPPSLLEVTNMSNGGFLDQGILFGPVLDNNAGTAMLVNTQLSSSLPKSGSGTLATVEFTARQHLGEGDLALTLADLVEGIDYQLIPVEIVHGTVRVCEGGVCARVFLPLIVR